MFLNNKLMMGRGLYLLPVTLFVLCITSCQKDLDDPTENSNEVAVWVLKSKKVQGFATSIGHTAFTQNATYYYDTAARTLIYRDTINGRSISEYKYLYEATGRLIRATSSHDGSVYQQADIHYNSDSLIDKIAYITEGTPHEGTFQWSRQGTDYFGQYTDPSINTTPYSDGKRTLTLNSKRQLMKEVYLSANPTGDQIEEVQRDDKGSVVLTKLYFTTANGKELRDSVVYTRDNTVPSRLSAFHSLWGKGIEWFSDGYFISFLVPPLWQTEYHNYSNTLTQKKEHFYADVDANGQVVMVPYYIENFVTEYDGDQNPVKQTLSIDGEKFAEITFVWQKIYWIK